jgi:hypothetical protein
VSHSPQLLHLPDHCTVAVHALGSRGGQGRGHKSIMMTVLTVTQAPDLLQLQGWGSSWDTVCVRAHIACCGACVHACVVVVVVVTLWCACRSASALPYYNQKTVKEVSLTRLVPIATPAGRKDSNPLCVQNTP